MGEGVVEVLTFKSIETILKTGGTQSWRLQPHKAAACAYAVVSRNASTREAEGPEPHKTAFMVGKIRDVVPSTVDDNRWLIRFSEYALCNVPDEWEGRYPVQYWTTDDYAGLDFEELEFLPMPNSHSSKISVPNEIMAFDLPTTLAKWVSTQVAAGSFADEGDYLRHLVRRDGERANWQVG